MARTGHVYIEGVLFKRQRGLHEHLISRNLIFQERFCRLTAESLEYYENRKKLKKPNGGFRINRIKIVESVPAETFSDMEHCFEIGDKVEVMYFAARTEEEKAKWMDAFRKAATDSGNQMLSQYHPRVYQNNKWSCCGTPQRISAGCQTTTSHKSAHTHTGYYRMSWGNGEVKGTEMSETYPPSEPGISATVGSCKTQSLPIGVAPPSPDLVVHSIKRKDDLLQVPGQRPVSRTESSESGYSSRPTSEIVEKGDSSPSGHRKLDTNSPLLSAQRQSVRDSILEDKEKEEQEEDSPSNQQDRTNDYVKIDSKTLPTAVTTLTWKENMLVAGSHDSCHVHVWDVTDEKLSQVKDVRVSGKVLAVDAWNQYIAIGSTVNQIFDTGGEQWKRSIIVANDEKLTDPPQHLVAFAPTGELATASAESDEVKLWPKPSETSNVILQPTNTIKIPKSEHISCLSVSSACDRPWLAVGVVQGKRTKTVQLINMKTKKCQGTFHAGCGEGDSLHIAFSPDGRQIAAGYGTDLNIWEVTSGILQYQVKDAVGIPISDLCYPNNGSYVLVGKSTGEVEAFSLDGKDPHAVLAVTIKSPESPSAATSIACSKDGKFLAVGYESGKLQLWKAGIQGAMSDQKYDEPSNIAELTFCNEPLLTEIKKEQFDSTGGECSSPDHKYKMVIPEGAVPNGKSVSIQHGVVPNGPFGPFRFPANIKPVSPIVGFSSNRQFEFQKPLQMTLPHCVHDVNCEEIVFLKAKHSSSVMDDTGEKVFRFEQIDSKISLTSNNATVDVEHMCLNCLGVYDKDFTEKARFCIIEAVPKRMGRNPFKIHFCVCYFLETCIKTCREQLGNDYDFNEPKMMTFNGRGPDPAIKIQLKQQPKDGWNILYKNAKTISTKKVCFWSIYDRQQDLVLACHQKIYPPRFTLEVHGRDATQDCTLGVEFQGANEELETEIFLSRDPGQETSGATNHPAAASNPRLAMCTDDNPSTSHAPVPLSSPHQRLPPVSQPFH